ncbi:MAG: polysaccharide deacetylase family protein [Thermoguttaceae bacterium]|jgi:peptidoglycan/xylan/chitin deacetylase (PgdA/CDA1 family)
MTKCERKVIRHSSFVIRFFPMPLWKQLLLNLYYDATCPLRAWNRRRWALQGRLPAIIFIWHRIADDGANDWTTTNALFARQIDWLQERFALVSLEEAQRRIRAGCNREPCVSITFDDGYADNCQRAIPLLIEKRIPCTYFVTVQNVLGGEPFPHDLAMGRRLAPNNLEQLRAMASAGVEIGVHTLTHPDLAVADQRMLHREVISAREELQKALDRPIRYFAFPYGLHKNLSRAAFAMSEAAGYWGACSAYGGFNFPGDNPFHLQRIPANVPMICLKNWATLDPRKLHIPRFEQTASAVGDSGETTNEDVSCKAASGS